MFGGDLTKNPKSPLDKNMLDDEVIRYMQAAVSKGELRNSLEYRETMEQYFTNLDHGKALLLDYITSANIP